MNRVRSAAAMIPPGLIQRTPISLAGEVSLPGAAEDLLRLAEKASIPMAPTLLRSRNSFTHPLNLGMLVACARFTNHALEIVTSSSRWSEV